MVPRSSRGMGIYDFSINVFFLKAVVSSMGLFRFLQIIFQKKFYKLSLPSHHQDSTLDAFESKAELLSTVLAGPVIYNAQMFFKKK